MPMKRFKTPSRRNGVIQVFVRCMGMQGGCVMRYGIARDGIAGDPWKCEEFIEILKNCDFAQYVDCRTP